MNECTQIERCGLSGNTEGRGN